MVELRLATLNDAKLIWEMQVESFKDLLNKYQDYDANPGNESIEKVITRLKQPFTYFYLIVVEKNAVGAIRVIDRKQSETRKRISPIFVLPVYQNRGIAQQAMKLAEDIHGTSFWELDTVLQERGNCHLYEKLGYCQAGKPERINDKMTLVLYQKD